MQCASSLVLAISVGHLLILLDFHFQDYLHHADPNCTPNDRSLLAVAETTVAAAAEVASTKPSAGGVVTKPMRGSAVVFWTILPRGSDPNNPWAVWQRDPLAWHGGVRPLPGGRGKWILQKFKELTVDARTAVERKI